MFVNTCMCMVSVHKHMIICSATIRVLATLARTHLYGLTIQAHATLHVMCVAMWFQHIVIIASEQIDIIFDYPGTVNTP